MQRTRSGEEAEGGKAMRAIWLLMALGLTVERVKP
jgi:hypothetical protein